MSRNYYVIGLITVIVFGKLNIYTLIFAKVCIFRFDSVKLAASFFQFFRNF